jgi:uroporphyrinogen-III synthase
VNTARALEGLGVVLTRPEGAAGEIARELEQAGARTFLFPALAIRPIEDSAALDAVLDTLAKCDLAIFVSANAVEAGFAALGRLGIAWPKGLLAAAVGELTAAALRNSGVPRVISPQEGFDSEALLALPELQAVQGRNTIVFRGEGGREHLKQVLESRGARVAYAECYRRERPEVDPAPLLAAWARGEVQVVGVLSAETLENFVAMIGPEGRSRLASTVLVVTHEAIARHAEARRFGRVLVSRPGAAALAATLARVRDPA